MSCGATLSGVAKQVLAFLDAQPVEEVELEELGAALGEPSGSLEPENRPAPGVPFDERIRRYITNRE